MTLISSKPEPMVWSCDTGQHIPCFDSCQLTRTWMSNIKDVPTCMVSTVGKKMAAVHFTTIPCEPNTAYKTQGKPNFYNICPYTKVIVYRRFEDFITLLYLFMNVVKGFMG